MKILIMGGTGAMGEPLTEIMSQEGYSIYVTSRSQHDDKGNIRYLWGNAKDDQFILEVLKHNFDVIIDFMTYYPDEFKTRYVQLLTHTGQYIFLSSSRVYANTEGERITEDCPRLLDTCKDTEYLLTNEYALAKAREENMLFSSGSKNWTIIRPYITYNDYRMQLGVFEKEQWLRRALNGKTIVLPRDIAERTTTLTYGKDVAGSIFRLINNPYAFGEVFHITNTQIITWGEVLNVYMHVLKSKFGIEPCVKMPGDSQSLQKYWTPYQIRYDRLFDRRFDNSKLINAIGAYQFTDTEAGLSACLQRFLDKPVWGNMNWAYEAWADKVTKEWTEIGSIPGMKQKLKYFLSYYSLMPKKRNKR